MNTSLRIIIMLALVLICSMVQAMDNKDAMEKEIQHLFDHLKNSQCEFNRNGKWYNTEDAIKHINKKYQYLIKKGLVNSTEQFIDRAASKSSMSGKPYLVKCDASEPIKSSIWFTNELTRFRNETTFNR